MVETPPFDEAVAAFLDFIRDQGLSNDLAWVFREDVTNRRRTYWVREPIPPDNAVLARRYYELGRRKGLGVTLELLGRVGGRSACHVWFPEDEQAASLAMQRPLKLLIACPPHDLISVRSTVVWRGLCLLNRWRRCVTFSKYIPARAEAGG